MWKAVLQREMPMNFRRFRLRPIGASDAELHMRLSNDPDVRRFIGPSLEKSLATATQEIVDSADLPTVALFVIETTDDGGTAGYCGFTPNRHMPDMDLLIALLPEFQGKGYGSEVLSALKGMWIELLGNRYCFATVLPENERAVAALSSNGFVLLSEYADDRGKVHAIYRVEGRRPEEQ